MRAQPSTSMRLVWMRLAANARASAGAPTNGVPLRTTSDTSLRRQRSSASAGESASAGITSRSAAAPTRRRPASSSRNTCAAHVVTIRSSTSGATPAPAATRSSSSRSFAPVTRESLPRHTRPTAWGVSSTHGMQSVRPKRNRFEAGHQTSDTPRANSTCHCSALTASPCTSTVFRRSTPLASSAGTSAAAQASTPSAACTMNGRSGGVDAAASATTPPGSPCAPTGPCSMPSECAQPNRSTR